MAILLWLWKLVDTLCCYIAGYFFESKKEKIPDMDNRTVVLTKSAEELAELIRTRKIKSSTVVLAAIERIKAVNPVINAMTDERFNMALDEAKKVDQILDEYSPEEIKIQKPFLGVPFTAKESLAVHGLFYTLGLRSRSHLKAHADSEPVRLMKQAGAIALAVSNVPEIDLWQETRNMVYGQTRNPFHTGRSVGGSSGGEAALVSSICSPFGLCNDIGGSSRLPAAYCGVFGHCASPGTLKTKGVSFRTDARDDMIEASIQCPGVIVRHARDIAPLLKVLAGASAGPFKFGQEVDVTNVKFYYVDQPGDTRCAEVNKDLREAMDKVIGAIKNDTGKTAERVQLAGLQHTYRLWRYWFTKEANDLPYLLANRLGRVKGWLELIKKMFGISPHTLAAILSITSQQITSKEDSQWAEQTTQQLRKELTDKLGKNGVLLFPSGSRPAPYHYTAFVRPYDFSYWAISNVLRFPATQVPLGLNSEGLPVGIQVMSVPYNDNLCIEVAKYLEKSFGGFVPPCQI